MMIKLKTLKDKKILLLPNLQTTDLKNNNNLKTSTLIKMVNFLTALEVAEIILDDTKEYDYIVSRYYTTAENYLGKGKEILVFNWCELNGGFFFDNFYDSTGKEINIDEIDFENIKTLNIINLSINNIDL